MNKKVFKLSIIDNKLPLFICFCFLAGTIISFYLSIIISTYFYLLAVPLLLITLYLIKLTIAAVKNEYKRLIKKEKHFNDGRHLEYFEDKKRQAKFELHIINGAKTWLVQILFHKWTNRSRLQLHKWRIRWYL